MHGCTLHIHTSLCDSLGGVMYACCAILEWPLYSNFPSVGFEGNRPFQTG